MPAPDAGDMDDAGDAIDANDAEVRDDRTGAGVDADYAVTLDLPDGTATVGVDADEYVLDAAEAAGVELPHSCRNGMCTSCVGDLVDGDVDQRDGSALAPHQEADGYVLLCSATPRTDCTVRAGDRIQDELLGLDAL